MYFFVMDFNILHVLFFGLPTFINIFRVSIGLKILNRRRDLSVNNDESDQI